VLIVGSGSLTHNLYEFRPGAPGADYAAGFAAWIREAVTSGDWHRVLRALDIAPHARRAHPTAEHFWPLLIAAGAAADLQQATALEGGVVDGVLAMDSFVLGHSLAPQTLAASAAGH